MMFLKHLIIFSIAFKMILTKKDCENGKCEKILDGEFTTIDKFPHTVAVLSLFGNHCGGSVLTRRMILTAAHCVLQINVSSINLIPNDIYVAAGHENYKKAPVKRKVIDHIIHECYDKFHDDIALLLLSDDLPLGPTIKRVVITKEFPVGVKEGEVSGWGQTKVQPEEENSSKSDTDSHTDILKYVKIKIYSQRKCCKILRHFGQLTINETGLWEKGIMCAGDRHANQYKKQPYHGDSGGPLVVSGNHQIGVVSSLIKYEGFKGVVIFCNVTHYYDWILEQAENLYRKHHVLFDEYAILTTLPDNK